MTVILTALGFTIVGILLGVIISPYLDEKEEETEYKFYCRFEHGESKEYTYEYLPNVGDTIMIDGVGWIVRRIIYDKDKALIDLI